MSDDTKKAEARAAKWKTQAGLAWRATFPDSDMSDAPKYWQRRQRWHNRRGTAGGHIACVVCNKPVIARRRLAEDRYEGKKMLGSRVVHFSDWHGDIQPLPSSDIYVCTGDMLPNTRACMWADKEPERYFQRNWIKANKSAYAKLFKPKSTILVVRGNHDYVDLEQLFEGHHVIELKEPKHVTIDGIKFAGFRGVPPICGEWADEMSESELDYHCSALNDVDVLVTHAAAYGRCDAGYGSMAIDNWLRKHQPLWHLHGHIHEGAGEVEIDNVRTSNAATTVRVLEIVL